MKTAIRSLLTLLIFNSYLLASDKESYIQKTQAELRDLTAKVESLQKKSAHAGSKTRQELDKQIAEVRHDIDAAQRNLTELQKSSEPMWNKLRKAVDDAMRQVKSAYERIRGGKP